MSKNTQKVEINFFWIAAAILVILFYGEPDLHSILIDYLSEK